MSDDFSKHEQHSDEVEEHLSAEQYEDEHVAEELLEQIQDDEETIQSASGDEAQDSSEGELLGELLDEVGESDKANETAAADEPVVDETIAIEPRTEDRLDESTEEESSSSFMPIAIIIALVVAGGAYFLLKSDPGEKSKVTTSNTSHEGSTAAKAETQKTASMPAIKAADNKGCICPAVLRGVSNPDACKLFATVCTPEDPKGACMVSSEGACAAYYSYGRYRAEAGRI